MATQLALQNDAVLCFVFVSPPPFPEEAMFGSDFQREKTESLHHEFHSLRPNDPSVKHEHLILQGNAGPKIVETTGSADLCVLSTHGRSGILRFVMGSVAQYVLRNSKCPVVLVKGMEALEPADSLPEESKHFVTEVMRQVTPIHDFNKMDDVLAELHKANETGAPVVDTADRCIGILTTTDIDNYHELQARYEARDESVISEMFVTDQYGHIRCDNHDFDLVKRHMTTEVISVRINDTIQTAISVFEANPQIHHLVVLNDEDFPVGILDSTSVIVRSIASSSREGD